MMRIIVLAAILSVVAACAQVAPEPDRDVDDALIQALLPPASLGASLSLSQLVSGEFGDQKYTFHAEVEVTPERMAVVGLSSMGVPLFTLEQDSREVKVEALGGEIFPFNPRHILSDFQIAYWPEATLREKYQTVGLAVRDTPIQGAREILTADGEVLVKVTYLSNGGSAGDIMIEHFDPPYRLHIKTFESSEVR